MRIITADECGLLKDISINKERKPPVTKINRHDNKQTNHSSSTKQSSSTTIINFSQDGSYSSSFSQKQQQHQQQGISSMMKRSHGVIGLAFCCQEEPNNSQLAFCALRLNGIVERWEGRSINMTGNKGTNSDSNISYIKTHSWDHILQRKDIHEKEFHVSEHPIGICSSQRSQNHSSNTANNSNCIVACCTSMGYVSIFNLSSSTALKNGLCCNTYEPYGKSSNTPPKITYTRGQFLNNDVATAMAMDYDGRRLAIGGRERETVLLDVITGSVVWKAKNLPPHPQTLLQQPLWTTTMTFLSPTDTTSSLSESTNLLVTGTAYKQVRIYDVRVDASIRRPVLYTPEYDSDKLNLFNHRLTSLCQLNSNSIVVGDAAGDMHTLDLRKMDTSNAPSNRCLAASTGRFSGPAGSVRQIVKHENLPIIACVGLDRMLRTYDTLKKKQLDCIYLKQRLNCMLMCADDDRSRSLSCMENEGEGNDGVSHLTHEDSHYDDQEDEVQDYICSDDQDEDDDDVDSDEVMTDQEDDIDENSDDQSMDESSSDYDTDTEESEEEGGKGHGKFVARRPSTSGTSTKRKRL